MNVQYMGLKKPSAWLSSLETHFSGCQKKSFSSGGMLSSIYWLPGRLKMKYRAFCPWLVYTKTSRNEGSFRDVIFPITALPHSIILFYSIS